MSDFEEGWKYASIMAGGSAGGVVSSDYISDIENAIKELEKSINDNIKSKAPVPQFQGDVFEAWVAGTYNVSAKASGSFDKAYFYPGESSYGSVDIHTKSGIDAQLKSYGTGEKSAVEQAILNPNTREAKYKGQVRIVPEDKLKDAQIEAHRRVLSNKATRPEVSAAYEDTEKKLTDVLSNKRGVTSKRIKRSELDQIAKEGKEGQFSAEKHGITVENSINMRGVFASSVKAGAISAAITAAIQITPEIVKCFDYLIKNGEINLDEVKVKGKEALSTSAQSFICGFVTSFMDGLIQKGVITVSSTVSSSNIIAAAVSIIVSTAFDSILVANGKLTAEEMGVRFMDHAFSTACFVAGMKIGAVVVGTIAQVVGFEFPGAAFVVGSLIGCALAALYHVGKKKFISICVDTGFACFGLVDQNYEMPRQYLEELGISVVFPDVLEPDECTLDGIEPDYVQLDEEKPDLVQFTLLKRELIAVRRVGYVAS